MNFCLLALSLLIFSPTLFAADKLKNAEVEAKGIGLIKFKHEDLGEPIAEPEKLQVFITCANSKKTRLLASYRMCKFEDYDFEPGIKTLHLSLISGRVVPTTGKVICDRMDLKNIDLTKACP